MRAAEWRGTWHVARNDLRIWARDRGALFWSFLGPVMFIVVFGFMFRAPSGGDRTVVWLHDEGESPVIVQALALQLRDAGFDVRQGAPAGTDDFEVRVGPHAADSLAAGFMPRIALRSPNTSATPREHTLVAESMRANLRTFLGLSPEDAHASLDTTALRARFAFQPTVALEKRALRVAKTTTGFQHSVPAYLVMFLLMNLFTYGAGWLIGERKAGLLRRLAVSPTTSRQVVLGKLVSRLAWSSMQMAWLLLLGGLFRVSFGAHPEALLAVLVAFALCATGLGLFYATLFDNPDKAAGLGSLVVMMMAALGGCWWPLEIVPNWMQRLAFALPTGWGYDALNRVMALDATLPQVALHLLVLGGIAALFLPLAIRRLLRPA